jgi:chromosome segregation ATPase
MPLSEQQVFEAADQIRESGRSPSALSIREITKTGSLGTIQKYLRKWRHQETVSSASINPPPESVLNAVRQFSEQLWQLSLQQAEKAASLKVRAAREEQQEALRDTDEAMEQVEDLQSQLEREEQQKAQLQIEIETLKEKLETQAQAHQGEREQALLLEQQQKNEHEQLRLQLSEREEQIQYLKDELRGLQEELETQGQQRVHTQDKLERALNEIAECNKAQAQWDGLYKQAQHENEALTRDIQQLQHEQRASREQLQQQDEQLQAQQVMLDELKRQQLDWERRELQLKTSLDAEKSVSKRLEALLERLDLQQTNHP